MQVSGGYITTVVYSTFVKSDEQYCSYICTVCKNSESESCELSESDCCCEDVAWSEALQQCAGAVHVVGLDINAVVGIAFAAFTIGILLTAALWLIHSRTGRPTLTTCTKFIVCPVQCSCGQNFTDVVSNGEFLPCDAMRCMVFVVVILSVRLFVTLVDCVYMVRPTIMISSPYGSPIILVSGDHVQPKIRRGSPRTRAISETGVGTNWRFWRFFDQ